jgi:hypothetical protein
MQILFAVFAEAMAALGDRIGSQWQQTKIAELTRLHTLYI